MDKSYLELKTITDKYYSDWKMPDCQIFINLLNKYGIKLRQKDGKFIEVNFSIPKIKKNSIVLGLRYQKKDSSYSEDLFVFQLDHKIVKGTKSDMEKILPEYKNTHKGNPNYNK